MKKPLAGLVTVLAASSVQAAPWQYDWILAAGEDTPKVEVAPLKYGKSWAYAVEIDDGPSSTLTVSQPLLAKYQWNDAPPGVVGGTNHPFVGTAAVVMGGIDVSKSSNLSLVQINELKKHGWGIVNHSYWHSGNHWNPSKFLKPENFKRELFWSQAVFAELLGSGRGSTHFVFPNGDPGYGKYLNEYGIRSGSRVGGSSSRNLHSVELNLIDLSRNYLDEGPWIKSNNPLQGFPDKPQPGDFIIDFTHGMNGDPASENNKRWITRLDHIVKHYGPQGDNSMWVAPTDEVVRYHVAAGKARTTVAKGRLTVDLPEDVAGSTLTLKITGLSKKTTLKAPEGGTLYRQGDTAWLTTPVIGNTGAQLVAPRVHRIYSGDVKNVIWDTPVAIAGVRLRQFGSGSKDFVLKIDAVLPDGNVESVIPGGEAKLGNVWGGWLLYPTIPDRVAPLAKELRVTSDKDLKEMEVWAVLP
jgi:hypothetical protein